VAGQGGVHSTARIAIVLRRFWTPGGDGCLEKEGGRPGFGIWLKEVFLTGIKRSYSPSGGGGGGILFRAVRAGPEFLKKQRSIRDKTFPLRPSLLLLFGEIRFRKRERAS